MKTDTEPPTEVEMRLKIGEILGARWLCSGGYRYLSFSPLLFPDHFRESDFATGAEKMAGWGCTGWNVPDFPKDLNAMHEAEKSIPRHLWTEYTMQLRKVIQRECDTEEHYILGCERSQLIADFWFYHATAKQRATAFLAALTPTP